MSTSIERSTMENSTILREIADFDINAPISVSITIEDDFDETPIETEIDTDDSRKNQETTNSVKNAFVPILEPKTENEANTLAPCMFTKDKTSECTARNNLLETSALPPKSLQNSKTSNDTLRKRKTVDVQICKPKKNKTSKDSAESNNCDEEIASKTLASHIKENYIQTGPSVTTCKNAKNTTLFESILPNVGPADYHQSDPDLDGNGLHQTDINKINEYVVNCLTAVSENMRRIMQAFEARRRQQISVAEFMQVKLLHFKSSYKTVVTILVPEEKNNELISTFLKDTLQRARVKSGAYFMHTYQDYANLLLEMIRWTKEQQQPAPNLFGNAEQTMPLQKSVIEPQVNKNSTQNKFQVSNSNTERDQVCIFQSGPPERAITINIDPHLNKYLQTATQNNSAETNQPLRGTFENAGDMSQGETDVGSLTRFVANNNKPARQSVTQSTLSQIPNPSTNHQQHAILPNSPSYSMNNMSHYSIPSQQMRDPTPALRMQLGKAPLQSHLIQPVESQRPSPRFGHSRHFAPQTQQPIPPPPPYAQCRHLQTQSGIQQQIPPQYSQVPVLQTHSTPTQSQYLQAQLGPQYIQPQQLQSQLGQSHLPVPEYNQTRPQVGESQPHPQQQTTEHWPSLVELLATESTPPLPYPNEQIQSRLTGQWQSQNQQPKVQPPAYRTEWQQSLNATFQAGQVPQQTQKGSPRSKSTDSGFISPLNFNVSTDQMVIDMHEYGITYMDN